MGFLVDVDCYFEFALVGVLLHGDIELPVEFNVELVALDEPVRLSLLNDQRQEVVPAGGVPFEEEGDEDEDELCDCLEDGQRDAWVGLYYLRHSKGTCIQQSVPRCK